ncbi:MAG: hypothetical protein ABSD67_18220 [Terracidiphilus sp.]
MIRLTRTKILWVTTATVLAVAFFPVPQVVAPDWTVMTLDNTRRPLQGITVREEWQQYSLEDSAHEEDRLSDNRGEAHFPRRTQWASFAGRFLGCARQIASTGAHASCGPHSYLVAFGNGVDTMDWEDIGQEDGTTAPWQRSTLVLKH